MTLSLFRARSTVVWIVLVVATMVSWAVGSDHDTGSAIAVFVLGVAMFKVRFVGLDFMELRQAPPLLRGIFEVYCVVLWCVLAGMYLWL